MSFKSSIQPLGTPIATAGKNTFFSFPENHKELLKTIKLEMKSSRGKDYIGEEAGKCIFYTNIERQNFLSELQEYATSIDGDNIEEIYKGTQQTRFNHLVEIRNNIGLYLPVFFIFPLHIAIKQNSLPIFVGSTPKLYTELQELNQVLHPHEQVKLGTFTDTFQASEEDIEDYEASHEGVQNFWPIFTYLILENLVKKSLQHKLPIFIFN